MSKNAGARPWRVFYTMARAEKRCEERLDERQIDVFLPKRVTLRTWSTRKKRVIEPLFMNYIFARVDERERLSVLRTDGIVRCVSFRGKPATISDAEIEQLKLTQKVPDRLAVDALRPPIGKKVTLVKGPLQGLTGEVIQHRGQLHVLVQVESIQQSVRVEVPSDWVQGTNLPVGASA